MSWKNLIPGSSNTPTQLRFGKPPVPCMSICKNADRNDAAHFRRSVGLTLQRSVAQDQKNAMRVAAKFRLLRPNDLLFVLFCRELMNEDAGHDILGFPALKIERPCAIVERIELCGFEHAVVERIADDVDHIVHLSDIGGGDEGRDPIAADTAMSATATAGSEIDQTDSRSE